MEREKYSTYQSSKALELNSYVTPMEGWTPLLAAETVSGKNYLKVINWFRTQNIADDLTKPNKIGWYVGTTGLVEDIANAVPIGEVSGIDIDEVAADHTAVTPTGTPYVVYETDDKHIWLWDGSSWIDGGLLVPDISDRMTLVVSATEDNIATFDASGQVKDSTFTTSDFALTTHATKHTNGDDDIQSATTLVKGLMTTAHVTALNAATAHSALTNNPHTTTLEQARTAGSTLAGDINFNSLYTGTSVKAPVSDGDIANKKYVDDRTQIRSLFETTLISTGTLIADRSAENDNAIKVIVNCNGSDAIGQVVIPTATNVPDGYSVDIVYYATNYAYKGDATMALYHTDTNIANLINTYDNTASDNLHLQAVSNGTTWSIILVDSVLNTGDILQATTSNYGITKLSANGATVASTVVQATDNRLAQATTSNRGTVETATTSEAQAQTSTTVALTPSNIVDMFGNILRRKVVTFSGWDMDTDASKSVAHTVPSALTKIQGIECFIYSNAGTPCTSIVGTISGSICGGFYFDATNVVMYRDAGGYFDAAGYNAATGFITIWYTT